MSTQNQAQSVPEAELPAALQAAKRLTEIRMQLQEAQGIYQADALAEVRAEWEEEVERIGRGEA